MLTDPAGPGRGAEAAGRSSSTEPRAVLGALAARVYGDPAARLAVVGVTGTQGKTTTTCLLEAGLAAAGGRPGWSAPSATRIAGRGRRQLR